MSILANGLYRSRWCSVGRGGAHRALTRGWLLRACAVCCALAAACDAPTVAERHNPPGLASHALVAASDSGPTHIEADIDVTVDSGPRIGVPQLQSYPTVHVEHQRLADGTWSTVARLRPGPAALAAARPSVILGSNGVSVVSAAGKPLAAPTAESLRLPRRAYGLTPPRAFSPPDLGLGSATGRSGATEFVAKNPVAQFLARRAAGRSRHDVLSQRLGRPQSVEGAIVRYRATIAERDVELEVDDATGAVLRSSVRLPDGSLLEARHSFVQNANGDLVKVSSRFSSGGGTSREVRRVMSVTYSSVVIR